MATRNQEIENRFREARSRMHGGTADGEQYDSVLRLRQLTTSLKNLGESADAELYRHFPVAAVAVLETHFKSVVSLTINTGSPYLERGLSLVKDRIKSAVDVLPSLHKKTVTLGEFVAHVLPFNSLSSLEVALSTLFDQSLKELVKNAVGIYQQRNEYIEKTPLVKNVAHLWEALSKAFEMRHILAHEAATKYEISYADALSSLKAVGDFTEVVDALLWTTVWKDEPLTQYEMNVHAWNEYRKTRALLAASLRRGLRIATEHANRSKYCKLHLDWKRASRGWTAFEEQEHYMGSIRPLMSAIFLDRAHGQRLASINAWSAERRHEDAQL